MTKDDFIQHPILPILVAKNGIITNLKGKAYKPYKTNGFYYLKLKGDGARKSYLVHRLVWEAYVDSEIPKGCWIDHINGDLANNSLENLEGRARKKTGTESPELPA